MRRALLAFALVLLPLAALAQVRITSADARAMRAVIEAQLDAFQRDDAERAFSYAAPDIRQQFGSADAFMAMVKNEYAVVYRPSKVDFEEPLLMEGEIVQPVRMIDGEGQLWLALYPMQRGDDGAWRINGCYLERLGGQET
jgi:hypothetical protein